MDLSKPYRRSNGEVLNIWAMVQCEPEWAAEKVQEGEEALSRIRELEAALTDAQERWIPVTERLPEKDGYYLAFVSGWEHAWQCEFASPWWYDCPNEPPITPTHWRELPAPPEQEAADDHK